LCLCAFSQKIQGLPAGEVTRSMQLRPAAELLDPGC